MRYTYQAVDGPLGQEPLALEDDQFDTYSGQIEIEVLGTGRVAIYRRRRKCTYLEFHATIDGDPWGEDDDVDWSYKSDAVRALIFVGWKG